MVQMRSEVSAARCSSRVSRSGIGVGVGFPVSAVARFPETARITSFTRDTDSFTALAMASCVAPCACSSRMRAFRRWRMSSRSGLEANRARHHRLRGAGGPAQDGAGLLKVAGS